MKNHLVPNFIQCTIVEVLNLPSQFAAGIFMLQEPNKTSWLAVPKG